jgi:hypothetical protein
MRAQPALREQLIDAVRRRHDALRFTAGPNAEVFDALLLLAAGSWAPADLAAGHDEVAALLREMHTSRARRLVQLGFTDAEAEEMSSLHTRNFM